MNEVTSRKTINSLIKEIKINGASITDTCNFADTLNSHFSTIGADLANKIPSRSNLSHRDYITKPKSTLELTTTNCSELFSLLTKLSKSKATWFDKIPARLLKECSDQIASSLCSIFDRFIALASFLRSGNGQR